MLKIEKIARTIARKTLEGFNDIKRYSRAEQSRAEQSRAEQNRTEQRIKTVFLMEMIQFSNKLSRGLIIMVSMEWESPPFGLLTILK